MQKRREKLPFCKIIHIDPNRNATKTKVFEKAVKRGYPQTGAFQNAPDQCERTKTEAFENAPIVNNDFHINEAV